MRIAIVGTHCCGKSTLAADFLAAHRDYVHEPEPYEWLEETESFADPPTAQDFYRQLEFSVERLRGYGRGARVIIERSPLDFVAYLRAIDAGDIVDGAIELAIDGIRHLDLIVFPNPRTSSCETPRTSIWRRFLPAMRSPFLR